MITPEEKESFEGPTTGFDSIEVKRIIFSYVYLKPKLNYRKLIIKLLCFSAKKVYYYVIYNTFIRNKTKILIIVWNSAIGKY